MEFLFSFGLASDARRLADVGFERDQAVRRVRREWLTDEPLTQHVRYDGAIAVPGHQHHPIEHRANEISQRVEVGRFAGAVRHRPPDRRQVLEELLLGVADQTGRCVSWACCAARSRALRAPSSSSVSRASRALYWRPVISPAS